MRFLPNNHAGSVTLVTLPSSPLSVQQVRRACGSPRLAKRNSSIFDADRAKGYTPMLIGCGAAAFTLLTGKKQFEATER